MGVHFEIAFLVDLARLSTTQTVDGCWLCSLSVVVRTTGVQALEHLF